MKLSKKFKVYFITDKVSLVSDDLKITITKADGVTPAIKLKVNENKIEAANGEPVVSADKVSFDNSGIDISSVNLQEIIIELENNIENEVRNNNLVIKPVALVSGILNTYTPTLTSSQFTNTVNQTTHEKTSWGGYRRIK